MGDYSEQCLQVRLNTCHYLDKYENQCRNSYCRASGQLNICDDIKGHLILTWRQRVGGDRKDTPCRANEDRSTFNVHAEAEKAHLAASTVVCKQPLRDPQAG